MASSSCSAEGIPHQAAVSSTSPQERRRSGLPIKAMELAMRHLSAAPALIEARAFAKMQGILDPRFLRDLGGAGDIVSRLHTFRRYIEAVHGQPIDEWLRRLDPERTGYVEREDFVETLMAEGYCVDATEAGELFTAMDVLRENRLPVERLGVMEDWGVFWPANSSTGPVWQKAAPTIEEFQRSVSQVVPSIHGGRISTPALPLEAPTSRSPTGSRSEGARTAPSSPARLRPEGLESGEVDVFKVSERLASTPIGQKRTMRGQDQKDERMKAQTKARVAESQARKRQNQAALQASKDAKQRLKEEIERENFEDDRRWETERHGQPWKTEEQIRPTGFDITALLGFDVFGQASDGRTQRIAAPKALATMTQGAQQRQGKQTPFGGQADRSTVRDRLAARKARRGLGSPR
mmetsp:Transcript_27226/g.78291  ORF Transcript_27226/g.78291 Transcript_27226/m.78291 type:complete len:408 (-) Transcript_27226:143-1366(-)